MAADSAVMVIDGAKGVEPQTRKLFKVCAMRHIPIFTFVNKMDRAAKDPFDLLDLSLIHISFFSASQKNLVHRPRFSYYSGVRPYTS